MRPCLVGLLLSSVIACGKSAPTPSSERPPPANTSPIPSSPKPIPAPPSAPAPGYNSEALGSLHFEISGGTPEARADFDRGLLALHSFWYEEATKEFQAAIDADKTFSMAYWGLAMSHVKLLWGDDDLAAARDALARMPSPEKLPPHDQAWAVSARALLRPDDVRSSRAAFVAVMEKLNAKFPDDESALFLSIGLLSTLQPNTPDEDKIRRRAGALAAEVFARNPKHPGAAHYMIHAYDTPALAEMALPAAKAYAAIAPAAFHALHMPAHVFARLGMWKDAIASCQAAWDASVAWVKRDKLSIDHQDFHSLSWLIEISFERGRRKDADRALALYSDAVRAGLAARSAARTRIRSRRISRAPASGRASTSCSHRSTRRRRQMAAAAVRVVDIRPRRAARRPSCSSAARCSARARKPRRCSTIRRSSRSSSTSATRSTRSCTRSSSRPSRRISSRRPTSAAGSCARCSSRARRATTTRSSPRCSRSPWIEEQEFTGEGTAGGLLHEEEIADALWRLGRAKDALVAFAACSRSTPDARTRCLARRARRPRPGDAAAARAYDQQLLAIWSEADPGTDGLDEAKRAISSH